MMKKILLTLLGLLVLVGIWIYSDVVANDKIGKVQRKSETKLYLKENQALFALHRGEEFDFSTLADTYEYINNRYDTSDFRLPSLIRILYEHPDQVPPAAMADMKKVLLDFKYWMDQPGEDSMCYWSENHQILFAAAEYLVGQYWPNAIFTNDGKTGREHQAMARERILTWLEQRWLYGFTEWYSPVYYTEDVAPLANLIDFADEEISQKSKIIMDLLLHDVATQSYEGVFISTSGRMYENQKRFGNRISMNGVIADIWGDRYGYGPTTNMTQSFSYLKKYQTPAVIKAIGEDKSTVEIKASNSLNLSELGAEGLIGQEDPQIMMQLGMESFTNPEVIANTVAYLENNNMFSNEFVHDFKMVNIGFLKTFGLLPTVSRLLKPVADGVAIQRANVYTYRTSDSMIATAQAYHPGTFGDQHHIWNATFSNEVSIFTTHPAKALSEKGALSGSPGYWVGNGRNPHTVQDKNVVLNIYQISEQAGFMGKPPVPYTHAHFPRDHFDEVVLDNNYAFGRLDNRYVALIARNPLNYDEGSSYDLLQQGLDSFWIFEASNQQQDQSFAAFMQRIKANTVSYQQGQLQYKTDNRELTVSFGGDFAINGEVQNLEYPRFESPYAKVDRKADTMTISHGGNTLFLDFYNGVRREQ